MFEKSKAHQARGAWLHCGGELTHRDLYGCFFAAAGPTPEVCSHRDHVQPQCCAAGEQPLHHNHLGLDGARANTSRVPTGVRERQLIGGWKIDPFLLARQQTSADTGFRCVLNLSAHKICVRTTNCTVKIAVYEKRWILKRGASGRHVFEVFAHRKAKQSRITGELSGPSVFYEKGPNLLVK
jgi:hypothetical protein